MHAGSVERFDADTDRARRSKGRLRGELLAVLEAAGADYDGAYQLTAFDEDDDPDDDEAVETGDLEDVVFDICWATRQALARDEHEETSRDDGAGQTAVAVMVLLLRARLVELGVDPNPLVGLDAAGLVARAGGEEAWRETIACDRPLLIARRVVRRALEPAAPQNIYRPWLS